VSWTITDNLDGSLHYKYVFDTNSQQGLSHFVWDISDNCNAVGACFGDLAFTGAAVGTIEFSNYSSANGNPGMPGSFYGVKVNTPNGSPDFTLEFDSNRIAVWSNFYAKAGNGESNGFALYNTGLANYLTNENTGHFIPVPDTGLVPCVGRNCGGGGNEVPEPESLPMLLGGLAILGAILRRRRKQV
jgi:PEP-CTERM motif